MKFSSLLLLIILFTFASCSDDKNNPTQNSPDNTDKSFSITTFFPTQGKINDTITIKGKGFRAERGAAQILFGNIPVDEYLRWSDTLIQVRVPDKTVSAKIAFFFNGQKVYTDTSFTLETIKNYKIAYIEKNSLYLIDRDGTHKKELPTDKEPFVDEPVQWSKDGQFLAYSKKCVGSDEMCLFISDYNGQNRHKLTDGFSPSWSHNGAAIVFSFINNLNRSWDTYIINTNRTGYRKLVQGGYKVQCSPVDHTIVFDRSDSSFIINSDGSGLRMIAKANWPRWSPNGKEILLYNQELRAIQIFDVASSAIRTLTSGIAFFYDWSPDGTKIVFEENSFLYIINADGTNRHQIASGNKPTFSPDATSILFGRDGNIFTINIDGSDEKLMAEGSYYAWSPVPLPQ